MSYPIEAVEGIAKRYAQKLRKAGITKTGQLLERCGKRKGRKALADETGISEKLVLKWTNMCDLMRIKGVGEEYSELLEAAGVDTVKELRKRKPENLRKAMAEVNEKKKLVRQLPGPKQVERWVNEAKTLDPMVSH